MKEVVEKRTSNHNPLFAESTESDAQSLGVERAALRTMTVQLTIARIPEKSGNLELPCAVRSGVSHETSRFMDYMDSGNFRLNTWDLKTDEIQEEVVFHPWIFN